MDRRTFTLLLTSTAARVLGRDRARISRGSSGRLHFALDDERRWSLGYVTDTDSVPLIQNATLGAWVADQFVTLADLEYSAVGERRPPGGRALIARGAAAGVYFEAEFLAEREPSALATVTLRIYPDSARPTLGGVRFFHAAPQDLIPGSAGLMALGNGYESSSPTACVDLASASDLTSHGTLGLTRGPTGLGLAFDALDSGDGTLSFTAGALEATSRFTPIRPLRPIGDTASLSLCYEPAGDGLSALCSLFVPPGLGDRDRLASAPAPTGWRPPAGGGAPTSTSDLAARLEACARLDPRYFRSFEIGDGYQRSAGDWETNDRFPAGHRSLTDQVHARGLVAGLWLAPFAVSERSGIPAAHDPWLLKAPDGAPFVWDTRDSWGGRIFVLDGAHPEVQRWLGDLAHRATTEWGYDYLALDWLDMATAGVGYWGGSTRAEAYRAGLGALRKGAGPDTFIAGARAPLQHSAGLINGMRTGAESEPNWQGLEEAARGAARRSFYHRSVWLNDPDVLTVGPPVEREAELRVSLAAVTGGVTFCTDDLSALSEARLAAVGRAVPVTTTLGRPVGATAPDARPPGAWVTPGAPGWWTVLLVNWADEGAEITLPLDALGVSSPCSAYDVWRGVALADVTDAVRVKLDPHLSATIALRVRAKIPQVIGSTRHVVQGQDVADEIWRPAEHTLRATAVRLDGRPYTVMVAVPSGLEPTECVASPSCELTTLASGHAVLTWAAGAARDITWALRFRRSRAG